MSQMTNSCVFRTQTGTEKTTYMFLICDHFAITFQEKAVCSPIQAWLGWAQFLWKICQEALQAPQGKRTTNWDEHAQPFPFPLCMFLKNIAVPLQSASLLELSGSPCAQPGLQCSTTCFHVVLIGSPDHIYWNLCVKANVSDIWREKKMSL